MVKNMFNNLFVPKELSAQPSWFQVVDGNFKQKNHYLFFMGNYLTKGSTAVSTVASQHKDLGFAVASQDGVIVSLCP